MLPAPVALPLPLDPALNGFTLFAQWGMLGDPSGLGFVTTAGLRLRIVGI